VPAGDFEVPLLVVQISKIEMGQRILRIGDSGACVIIRRLLHSPHAKCDGTEVHQRARGMRVALDRLTVSRDGLLDGRSRFFES